MTDPQAMRALTKEREKFLRSWYALMLIAEPTAKTFDVQEMTELVDDVGAMLGTIAALESRIEGLEAERLTLAKLAADSPQFFNPLVAFAAQELRDRVLAEAEASRR
jgi:hypothetical protein